MKKFFVQTMFVAGILAAFANVGSTQVMTAEIPFAFRAGSVLMQPGSYQLDPMYSVTGSTLIRLQNRDNRHSVFVPQAGREDPKRAWVKAGAPKLGFECVETRCVIRQLWTGSGEAYDLSGPKLERGGASRSADVHLGR